MPNEQQSPKRYSPTYIPDAVALTIAGSDPSGGAGLQADLKTFQQLGVYGMSVVTLITVQNTQAVQRVEVLSPSLVRGQLDAVLEDIPPRVIKTGALGNAEVVRAVGERLYRFRRPIVVDPVLVSKHGQSLVTENVVKAYKRYLLPHAFLVTPNRFEAELLTGIKLDSEAAVAKSVRQLMNDGAQHVLLKLGVLNQQAHHVLGLKNENVGMAVPSLTNNNTHGSGCILAAALAARLALGETDIKSAVRFAIQKAFEAINGNTCLGKGVHPAETRAMLREDPSGN
jgi:hydroxymethylpyrimidine/phosphomethylpyrimidine kinase